MTPLVRNVIAWVAFGAIGLLAWAAFGLATMPIAAQSARLTVAQSVEGDLIARRDRLSTELARLAPVSQSADPRLDAADDLTSAMQKFQERVRNALSANGGVPLLSQTATEPAGQSLTVLTILLRARLGETALMAFLKAVESGMPSIVVSELQAQQQPGDLSGSLEVTANLSMIHANAR